MDKTNHEMARVSVALIKLECGFNSSLYILFDF